jgi:hypothetical protein
MMSMLRRNGTGVKAAERPGHEPRRPVDREGSWANPDSKIAAILSPHSGVGSRPVLDDAAFIIDTTTEDEWLGRSLFIWYSQPVFLLGVIIINQDEPISLRLLPEYP